MGVFGTIIDKVEDAYIKAAKLNEKAEERMRQDVMRVISDDELLAGVIDELSLFYLRFVCQRLEVARDFRYSDISDYEWSEISEMFYSYSQGDIILKDGVIFDRNGNDITTEYPPEYIVSEMKNILKARYSFLPVIEKNRMISQYYFIQGQSDLKTGTIADKNYDKKYIRRVNIAGIMRYAPGVFNDTIIPAILSGMDEAIAAHPDVVKTLTREEIRQYYGAGVACQALFDKILNVDDIHAYENIAKSWRKKDEELNEWAHKEINNATAAMFDLDNRSRLEYEGVSKPFPPFTPEHGQLILAWELENVNEFGLMVDKNKILLEKDIFNYKYIPNIRMYDMFLIDVAITLRTYIKDVKLLDTDLEEIQGYGYKHLPPCVNPGLDDEYNGIYNSFEFKKCSAEYRYIIDWLEFYLWVNHREYYIGLPEALNLLCLPLLDDLRLSDEYEQLNSLYTAMSE